MKKCFSSSAKPSAFHFTLPVSVPQRLSFFFLLSLFTLPISLLTAHFASAQDITPNSNFEMWTLKTSPTQYLNPDGWDQLNDETNFLGILTCVQSTDAYNGAFAAKLITKTVTILGVTDTANGIITTGKLITVPPYGINGGVPSHIRPDSIYGWIKYEPTPGDACQIQLDLFTANKDTVGVALFQTSQTLTAYTRFSAPVIYKTSETPDTLRWLISSSDGFNSLPNSTLYVDNIGIVYGVGISEPPLSDFVSVSPNPAGDFLNIRNEKLLQGTLQLYNTAGERVREIILNNGQMKVDVAELLPGTYLLELISENATVIAAGKLVVQR